MKQLSKIVMLTVVGACIIVFWLMPGINQAADKEYVRIYEDTDYQKIAALPDYHFAVNDTTKNKEKKYKKETIKHKDKLSKVNGKMFSRIAQFEEVPTDSGIVKVAVPQKNAKEDKMADHENTKDEKVVAKKEMKEEKNVDKEESVKADKVKVVANEDSKTSKKN